ncbi:MAG: serine/threonine protein kinase, partial [Kofleriaceae bacterium]|nr:serine/threonine protein kinase [Kofleriaceae bacterium]
MAKCLNDRYLLLRQLGSGSQGVVYLAKDVISEREVAVKAVRSDSSALIAEFEWLAAISHPCLAEVLDVGVAQIAAGEVNAGDTFFVSEFIAGPDVLSGDRESEGMESQLIGLCHEIASALSQLHRRGLAHGDVKPDNMRYRTHQRKAAVLLDLGLAQAAGQGIARGTLAYMAPEALGGYTDERSDIYSLGASLVEVATGAPLHSGETRQDIVSQILNASEVQLRPRLAHLATPLADLLVSLVASAPADRPSGIPALLAHIDRIREALHLPTVAATHRPNFARPEFTGREEALSAIVRAFAEFSAGRSSEALAITGLSGSGRTRTMEEALLLHCIDAAKKSRAPLLLVRLPAEQLNSDPQATIDSYAQSDTKQVLWIETMAAV